MYREIKGEMARHGIRASQLAERIGISPAAFSLKMTGTRDWKLGEMLKIQEILAPERTLDDLFTKVEQP